MLLHKFYFLLALGACCCVTNSEKSPQENMSFDYFLGPEAAELAREQPFLFNPDEGHDYRKEYESKYGYRGERLIAMLGGGAAPLAIFDAGLLGKQTTTTTASPTEDSITERPITPSEESGAHSASTVSTLEEHHQKQTERPVGRNYVEIDSSDRKHNGFLTENFLQNNIPQEQSFKVSPDGVIYKRLYGAIWNYGAKGLPKNIGYNGGLESLRRLGGLGIGGLGGFYNGWSDLPIELGQQYSSLDTNPQLRLPLAHEPQYDGELNKPSQKEYAGLGEPSIMVQSYSYR